MSGWIVKHSGGPSGAGFEAEHQCSNEDCGIRFDLSLSRQSEHDLEWKCPECNAPAPVSLMVNAMPVTIVRGNSDFSERQNKRLYDRSTAHFKKYGREEAIERQRAQFKREGMVQ
jgi:hypothetical protein